MESEVDAIQQQIASILQDIADMKQNIENLMKRIQSVIDIFSQNNTMYMVFSYVASQSLQSYVEQNGLFTWEDCEKQFLPVIQALSTLQQVSTSLA